MKAYWSVILLLATMMAPSWAMDQSISGTASQTTQAGRCKAFMQANPDLVCLPLEVARAADLKLAQAEYDASLARIRRWQPRWGVGCGVGTSLLINQDWQAHWSPTPLWCGLSFGWDLKH